MTFLKKVADMAYIVANDEQAAQLATDVEAIMDYVDQLRQVDTTLVAPLYHPLDLNQRLRPDEASSANHSADLKNIAPSFSEDLYLVPKVIDTAS